MQSLTQLLLLCTSLHLHFYKSQSKIVWSCMLNYNKIGRIELIALQVLALDGEDKWPGRHYEAF